MEILQIIIATASILASIVIISFVALLGLVMLDDYLMKKSIKKRRTSKKPKQWIEKQSAIAKKRKRDWHGRFVKVK